MSFGLKSLIQRAGITFAASLVLLACKGGGTSTPDTGVDDGGVVDMGMVEDGDMGDACSAQPDEPDLAGADTNCDGIDGDEDDAIFVTANGAMTLDPSVGTRANPAGGITLGLNLAMTRGKSQVLVALGNYTESVTIVAGIGVHGSYDNTMNWARTFATSTHIAGTMVATNIATRTPITRLTVTAPNATTPGGSSIAMRIVSSSGIEISDATFTAGAGMPGTAGGAMATQASGGSQPGNVNPSYRVPGIQVTSGDILTNPEVAGGSKSNHAMPNPFDCSGLASCGQIPLSTALTDRAAGGSNTCGCGAGGQGGTRLIIPASLSLAVFQDFIGSFVAGRGGAGSSGQVPGATCAPRVEGGGGAGGYWNVSRGAVASIMVNYIGASPSGTIIQGANGGPGTPGADGDDGDPGLAGTFDATGYVPSGGTAGATGVGGGGGGGGGSGASALCADEGVHNGVQNNYEELWVIMTGGMGGGGGSGGCGGVGGNPGAGGGASIAIYVWDSEPTFVRVTASGGVAGAGGAGQAGQPGGTGGNGAVGREFTNDALGFGDVPPNLNSWINADAERWCVGGTRGGTGGRGGDGGDGGGGGGGAGGASIGIVLAGGSTTSASSSEVTATGGTAGAGGAGGDANPGAAGASAGTFMMP